MKGQTLHFFIALFTMLTFSSNINADDIVTKEDMIGLWVTDTPFYGEEEDGTFSFFIGLDLQENGKFVHTLIGTITNNIQKDDNQDQNSLIIKYKVTSTGTWNVDNSSLCLKFDGNNELEVLSASLEKDNDPEKQAKINEIIMDENNLEPLRKSSHFFNNIEPLSNYTGSSVTIADCEIVRLTKKR